MFGFSFLMKQQAVFFILFGGLAILLPAVLEKPFKLIPAVLQGIVYSIATVLPYGITILVLKKAGAFDKFWFWTMEYASKYASGVSLKDGKSLFASSFEPMWQEFGLFWLLFFAGVILIFLTKFSMKQKLFAVLFALFAFLTICPGFYFRKHYFISLLPAVGLLGAFALYYVNSLITHFLKIKSLAFLPFIIFCIAAVVALSKNEDYYFNSEPNEVSITIYGSNPFVESVEIAKYIKENSDNTDKIAVLGSEPQIFFYANRHSATGYIYTYGLMEIHAYNKKMQEEMIAEIEKNKPKFFVYCNISASWLMRPESPRLIFEWANKYLDQYYELTGIVDIAGSDLTYYKWNNEAKTYKPVSNEFVKIFKRKNK
jgi:hypothetical protein